MHVVIPSKEKRRLLRLQRRALVLEPGCSSDSEEDDFFRYRSFFKQLQNRYKYFDEDRYGDETQKKLLDGVLDRHALVPKKAKKNKSMPHSDSEVVSSWKDSARESSVVEVKMGGPVNNKKKQKRIPINPVDQSKTVIEMSNIHDNSDAQLNLTPAVLESGREKSKQNENVFAD